jgi:riboflavin synthase
MFTGIIEQIGKVTAVRKGTQSLQLWVHCAEAFDDVHIGDSVAINGACLTVTVINRSDFCFDAVPETVQRTNLQYLHPGSPVNLERAMLSSSRFGGHMVQGHIDGTGILQSIEKRDNARVATVGCNADLLRYMIPKGSVALDGISLTIAEVTAKCFTMWIIPHTWENTALRYRKVGDVLNIETDMIARYVERFLMNARKPLTMSSLEEMGFLDDY